MASAIRVDVAVRENAELGEGPTWDPVTERLIWVDILGARVHTYEPGSGRRTVLATEQHVGAAKPRTDGGLVVNLREGVGSYATDGTFTWLHREPVPGRRGNDAGIAPDGALWAGSMAYDEAPGGGNLIRLAPDGTVTTVLDTVTVSNGIGWSPDGSRMYYADTPTQRIDVFDVEGEHIVRRREFATVEDGAGYPDGMTVDADGCVWTALWDGGALRRYTPEGKLDRVVPLPVRRPTACAFAGADLSDLYVTSARAGFELPRPLEGSLLVLRGAGRGLAQPAFG